MDFPRRNYLWRKQVNAEWLIQNESELDRLTGHRYAVIERSGRKRAVVEVFSGDLGAIRKLKESFGGSIRPISRAWLEGTVRTKARPALHIGKRLVVIGEVKPGRKSNSTSPNVLVIPAGAAFGTGDHTTTAMCLRMLEEVSRLLPAGWTMLDVGTGSAILALAGRSFGAGKVVAIDNDPWAISTGKQNARLNHIRGVRFVVGDALRQTFPDKFDVITANLFSELLIQALPKWKAFLKPKGKMILSGVLRSQENVLVRALRTVSFSPLKIRRRGKWIALLAGKKQKVI
jgi:ribosomal protein L11 methyltransferase